MSNDKLSIMNDDIREQLASIVDEDFNTSSMPELTIPKAGSLKWDLDDTALKTVRGTILCWQQVRVYYADEFTGGNEPPDCSSDDCKFGLGEPGGACKQCPFAQWGSGKNGGQACAQRMKVLFLVEGQLLPIYLNLPPSSLSAFKNYAYALSSKGLPIWGVVTELSLVAMKNKGGIEYNQVAFSNGGILPDEERENIRTMRATFAPMLAARPVVEPAMDVDEYTG